MFYVLILSINDIRFGSDVRGSSAGGSELIELNNNLCFSDIKFGSDVRGSSAGGSEANKEGSDKSRLENFLFNL